MENHHMESRHMASHRMERDLMESHHMGNLMGDPVVEDTVLNQSLLQNRWCHKPVLAELPSQVFPPAFPLLSLHIHNRQSFRVLLQWVS